MTPLGENVFLLTDKSEKSLTRELYERTFDDPKAFIDYYYTEKCADNRIIACIEQGKIISMLHLNPYGISVSGKETKIYYIVAVATDEALRRKGYMTRVMKAALSYMNDEGIPFCTLMPKDESIYTPFGFETVCGFVYGDSETARLSYDRVKSDYDVYIIRDERYLKRQALEKVILDAAGDVCPDGVPVIMARVVDKDSCAKILDMKSDATEKEMLSKLRSLKCYFREEV